MGNHVLLYTYTLYSMWRFRTINPVYIREMTIFPPITQIFMYSYSITVFADYIFFSSDVPIKFPKLESFCIYSWYFLKMQNLKHFSKKFTCCWKHTILCILTLTKIRVLLFSLGWVDFDFFAIIGIQQVTLDLDMSKQMIFRNKLIFAQKAGGLPFLSFHFKKSNFQI